MITLTGTLRVSTFPDRKAPRTLCRLHRLVYCPWQNNRRCGKSLLGCRRCRPGRQDVFRSLSPKNESGLTPFPHRRSLPPNGSVRLQQVKIHSAIHYNLCYNRAHNISVPSCHFPERCKQEEINMDIKEEIHALSEEMLTNLGRLVAIDSQLSTPSEENHLVRVLQSPGRGTEDCRRTWL